MPASEPKRSIPLDAFLLELEVHGLSATRGAWDYGDVGERTAAIHALRPDQPFPAIATDLSRRDATYVLAAQPENIIALVKRVRQICKLIDTLDPVFAIAQSIALSPELTESIGDLHAQARQLRSGTIEVAP